ncbi:MAG: hypothetical protein ABIP50_03695 [Candidatus Saccharimonadales bacterium]
MTRITARHVRETLLGPYYRLRASINERREHNNAMRELKDDERMQASEKKIAETERLRRLVDTTIPGLIGQCSGVLEAANYGGKHWHLGHVYDIGFVYLIQDGTIATEITSTKATVPLGALNYRQASDLHTHLTAMLTSARSRV